MAPFVIPQRSGGICGCLFCLTLRAYIPKNKRSPPCFPKTRSPASRTPDLPRSPLPLLRRASRHIRSQKQWITFSTFFISSEGAGNLLAKAPTWLPITFSILAALITAYTIAVNLGSTIRSMARFHYSWSELALAYETLWNNVYADDAQLNFDALARRGRDLGELATTDAPNNQKRIAYWQDHVFRQHNLAIA